MGKLKKPTKVVKVTPGTRSKALSEEKAKQPPEKDSQKNEGSQVGDKGTPKLVPVNSNVKKDGKVTKKVVKKIIKKPVKTVKDNSGSSTVAEGKGGGDAAAEEDVQKQKSDDKKKQGAEMADQSTAKGTVKPTPATSKVKKEGKIIMKDGKKIRIIKKVKKVVKDGAASSTAGEKDAENQKNEAMKKQGSELGDTPKKTVKPGLVATKIKKEKVDDNSTTGENTPTLVTVTVKKVKKKKIVKPTPSSPYQKSDLKITRVGQAVVISEPPRANYTIHSLYREMSESVISDRWCIPEPMWDPHTNHEVMLCYEVDVLMDGSVRMKRCIKILDNFELIVLLDGADKTHLFRDKHPTIKSSQELLDLIRKVTMVKVCSGIVHCDSSDFDNLNVKVNFRGGSWYSSECNVEVERGCLGNICKRCTSLRNTIRRKVRRQYGGDSANSSQSSHSRSLLSNSLKPVVRSLGEALYSNLNHMSGVDKFEEEMLMAPPERSEQVFHPELKIYMNSDLKQRLDEVAANPTPPLTKIEHVVEFDPRTMTKTLKRIHTPITTPFRGLVAGRGPKRVKFAGDQNQSFVMGNNGELTLIQAPNGETIQLPEGYVLAEDNNSWGDNVVIQKLDSTQEEQLIIGDDNSILVGSNFTLQDGEEYEVIGEAASGEGEAIQVLPLNTNSDIEIIEVDENMIQLVDEDSQPEIQPVDASSDIFKFLQAQSRLQV